MEAWMVAGVSSFLAWLALPQVGLGAVFVVAFVSATLLPLGSEPALFAFIKLHPEMLGPALLVATLGNTLGGVVTWWLGWLARRGTEKVTHHPANTDGRALRWLQRFGPKACLLSWLPIVGDPLCAVAGWLNLPFWPCVAWMAAGKCARYITTTAFMLWVV
ncbi:YqaA family protein [Aquabacterium sp. CECT 9606]|jgi:membrane protein YqaA with SNARE-associated domain|uniref:YqaA family protein n=1 Tax=Aquabacterium sp. CECT 9606 TaxID=2845822 RepID=UPI001E285AA0|nr:YqaA family protein [Aquabacterium sp. CECT 9606]